MIQSSERRHLARYPAQHFDVRVKSRRSESYIWETGELVSVDFNRYGVALMTRHPFSIGDQLSLLITTDSGLASQVQAVVCNRSRRDDEFRFGLSFEFSEDSTGTAARQSMTAMEMELSESIH